MTMKIFYNTWGECEEHGIDLFSTVPEYYLISKVFGHLGAKTHTNPRQAVRIPLKSVSTVRYLPLHACRKERKEGKRPCLSCLCSVACPPAGLRCGEVGWSLRGRDNGWGSYFFLFLLTCRQARAKRDEQSIYRSERSEQADRYSST